MANEINRFVCFACIPNHRELDWKWRHEYGGGNFICLWQASENQWKIYLDGERERPFFECCAFFPTPTIDSWIRIRIWHWRSIILKSNFNHTRISYHLFFGMLKSSTDRFFKVAHIFTNMTHASPITGSSIPFLYNVKKWYGNQPASSISVCSLITKPMWSGVQKLWKCKNSHSFFLSKRVVIFGAGILMIHGNTWKIFCKTYWHTNTGRLRSKTVMHISNETLKI